ncbi:MAG: hypothetical protein ABI763_11660, partial [Bacteroidota bacterium]
MTSGRTVVLSLFLFFGAVVSEAQKSPASEYDLKKQAEKLFEKENYPEAATMYSQLLSLYPRDAVYNYRYGVCLLMSGQDKTGAASYLEVAAKSKETDADVNFYLGRSYMFMDHFNEAINAFTLFKKEGASSKQSKLQPDQYIHNCENANLLRKDRKNVVVLNKTKVNRATFFANYDFTNAAGKLLTTPDRFLTPIDKARMSSPVMFMTKDGETIYYASYGKKGEHGKDIYRVVKLQGGVWSEPVNLSSVINTDGNEDFPYLDKDGRTFYFSSNAHNSIGGYDVFKSQYDFNTAQWSEPVNVGIPINTVDDDIFYMPSTTGETAVYSTAVECESGRIEMRSIKLGDVVNNVAVINGKYFSQDQVTRRDARITVIRTKDNGVVSSVKTDKFGDYELILPTGDDYMLIVEGGSYIPHAENFSIPEGFAVSGLKQRVNMNKAGDIEEMTMSNYFTPSAIDASTASIEKPTQVTKSEFDVKDTASRKMQPITFEGKTLFVAPPSLRNYGGPDVDPSAFATKEKQAETNAGSNPGSDAISSREIDSDEDSSGTVAELKNDDSIADEKKAEPIVSEKTSNTELVKMAFEEAQATLEEAIALHEGAVEKMAESKSLDSLSKVQVKEANQLLTSGDKEQSQQIFSESQQNALDAVQKNKEAQNIEADANVKDAESKKSFQEASQFMKELKVDTTTLAYQSISGKESATAENENRNSTGRKKEGASPVTVNQGNDPIMTHAQKAGELAEESGNLILASLALEQKAEKTTDKTQKAKYENRAKALKRESELKKSESEKETALATKEKEQPFAVNANKGKAADSKAGAAPIQTEENPGNAGAKNENGQSQGQDALSKKEVIEKTSDSSPIVESQPESPKTESETHSNSGGLSTQAKENTGDVATKNKKGQSQAQDDINKMDVSENTNAGNPVVDSQPETLKIENKSASVDKGKQFGESGNHETAVENGVDTTNKINNTQAHEPKEVPVLQKEVDVTAMHEGKKIDEAADKDAGENKINSRNESSTDSKMNASKGQEANDAVALNGKSESNKVAPESESVRTNDAGENTMVPVINTAAAIKVKIDPLALTHYQNYKQRLDDSKKTENISKETEAKLLTNNTKEKRDSLAVKSADLNKQSIMQWQEAQKELSQAKEIDPDIEEKVQSIPASSAVRGNETGKSNDETAMVSKPVMRDQEPVAENVTSQAENNNAEPKVVSEVLDTTKAEYPQYVKTQKEILEKQTETVNLFVEGMQLNKKAVAIKADEMKLRDQAEVTSNKKEKAKLIEKADSLSMEAEIVTNHSKEMLAVAQKNTGTVKALTLKSNELKAGLIVAAHPESNQQPVAGGGTASQQDIAANAPTNSDKKLNENKPGGS